MSDIQKDTKKDVQNKELGNTSLLNKFKDLLLNDYHTFLIRKTEKLTSALYVITGFLPSDEPVRNRLRVCSLDLIERAAHPALLSEEGLSAFIARTSEIGAILQTARSAGLISPMNAELLSEEYAHLAEFVKKNSQEIRESNAGRKEEEVLNIEGLTESYKGQTNAKPLAAKKAYKPSGKVSNDKGHSDRKRLLMELLNKKDKISIKDAVSVIKSCSEKTLQRELLSLVEEGIAVKEGERRWSTYRMAPVAALPS
jgi:hypothetical protein